MELKQYSKENPWRGLLSYREGEILYGRDDDIRDLTQCVLRDKYTLLYGKSGIGKSSILNSAIIPALRRNGFTPIVIRLSHREGNYIEQIHKTISETIGENGIHEEISRKGDKETLYEYLHRHTFWKQDNTRAELFLLFDQFEEIFTLQTDETVKKVLFSQLEDLCNDTRPDCLQPGFLGYQHEGNMDSADNQEALTLGDALDDVEFELPNIDFGEFVEDNEIRMIFTIREDFLSEFDYYTASIPLLKQNRYYLRPINEEQAAQIIMRPCPGLVSEEDAWLIISKVTNRTDFKLDGNPELTVDSAVLSLYMSRLFESRRDNEHITKALIEMHGDEIISGFYKDAISSISSAAVDYLEDNLLTGQGRRDNITEFDAINDGHVSKDELELLVNEKKILRRFNYAGVLRIEYVHDILCPVVTAHREERRLEKQQEEERKHNKEEQEHAIRQIIALKRRNNKLFLTVLLIALFLTSSAVIFWDGLAHNIERRYGMVIKRNGRFEGIEMISKDESTYRNHHFVFYFRGRWNKHPYLIEARDGYGKLTTEHDISPYILDIYDETDNGADSIMVEKMKSVCQWEFVCFQHDFVEKERAYDKEGRLIYSYNRSMVNDSVTLGAYFDGLGFPLLLRDSTYFFTQTTCDSMRNEVLFEYYDDQGVPITNQNGAYQTRYYFLSNGVCYANQSCFFTGLPMNDRFGNCGMVAVEFTKDSLRATKWISVDCFRNPCRTITDSVIVYRFKYDEHGRMIEESYWDENGHPDVNNLGIHSQSIEYNRYGQCTKILFFDKYNNRCNTKEGLEEINHKYDQWGNEIFCQKSYDSNSIVMERQYANDTLCVKEVVFSISTNGDTTFYSRYYYDEEERLEILIDEDGLIQETHYDKKKNVTQIAYYDCDNCPREYNGYHAKYLKYNYLNKDTTILTAKYVDVANNLRYSEKYLVDSLNNSISLLVYSSNGEFNSGEKITYDDLRKREEERIAISNERIGEDMLTKRLYKNGLFYYKLYSIHSIKPSSPKDVAVALFAVNEFNQQSLITGNGVCHAFLNTSNGTKFFNEFGEQINPNDDNWGYLAYVEIINKDTVLGFKDGDIILACNNWIMAFYKVPDDAFWLFPGYDDTTERHFTIARYNHKASKYNIVNIVVPSKIKIEKYVEFNRCRCTISEEMMVEQLLDNCLGT